MDVPKLIAQALKRKEYERVRSVGRYERDEKFRVRNIESANKYYLEHKEAISAKAKMRYATMKVLKELELVGVKMKTDAHSVE